MWEIARAVAIFLGIPLVAGYLTRRWGEARHGREWYETRFLPRIGPVALWSAAHLMLHIPNAKIVETVRAYYDGWYSEVMTAPVPIRDGMITLGEKPGLGVALREEVLRRPDVHIEFSDETHRINMSKG